MTLQIVNDMLPVGKGLWKQSLWFILESESLEPGLVSGTNEELRKYFCYLITTVLGFFQTARRFI